MLAFRRGDLVCVTVFDGASYEVPVEWDEPVLTSDPATDGATLPAGTSGWYRG